MTSTNESAGIWIRVSTGGQDEAQQVPAVEGHCESHGYRITRRYELNDKSASKGEQQAKLDEMLEDMRNGAIKVLVCWRSNRLERRGVVAVYKLLSDVKKADGRIESVQEPMFGIGDMTSEMLTTFGAISDEQFSAKLSQDTQRAIDNIKANGFVYNGNAPWGFEVVGPKYGKTLRPTELCRAYVPQIFQRCIDGQSLRQIAVWLDSENVPTARGGKWNEGSVRWIIRCRTYAEKPHEIIRPTIFDRANDALKNRGKRGPAQNPPMLAKLRCNRCGSPMYRIKAGKRAKIFYRCYGSGPQRKGCGNMVPLALTDFIVASQIFVHSTEPHTIKSWVDGQNWDDEISNVKQSIREAADAERFGEMPALQTKLADYRSRDNIPGHYDYIETGQTVGAHFWSLDNDGKREYLATRDIRVERVPAEVSLSGIRVVIDGQEHEVTVREWNEANRALGIS
jgi:DNA invertase Pin-like site-specific DNA recombinase